MIEPVSNERDSEARMKSSFETSSFTSSKFSQPNAMIASNHARRALHASITSDAIKTGGYLDIRRRKLKLRTPRK
jgi:hypothetical protein